MLPSRCQVCGLWPSRTVCPACESAFAPAPVRCATCALPCPAGQPRCGHCLREPPTLSACLAAVDYAYPWAGLVQRFKFRNEPAWARPFARQMRGATGVAELLDQADGVLPVPLTPARLASRGYNQAWELVKALHPAHARADLLVKLLDLPDQHSLNRAQRLRNARQAFAAAPHAADAVSGKHLLLVDDVMTTGATLEAAADVLVRAGAARVSALVYARTVPDL